MSADTHERGRSSTWILIVIVVIVVIALGIRLLGDRFSPDPLVVAEAPGLVTFNSFKEAGSLPTNTLVPDRLFGSTVHLVAHYTEESSSFPKDSVTIVLARDNFRFTEILQRPGMTIEEGLRGYEPRSSERATINGYDTLLIELVSEFSQCIPPREDRIGLCRISRILFLQTPDSLISIAGDGEHITAGEMVGLAKSLVPINEKSPE